MSNMSMIMDSTITLEIWYCAMHLGYIHSYRSTGHQIFPLELGDLRLTANPLPSEASLKRMTSVGVIKMSKEPRRLGLSDYVGLLHFFFYQTSYSIQRIQKPLISGGRAYVKLRIREVLPIDWSTRHYQDAVYLGTSEREYPICISKYHLSTNK